MYKEVAEDKCFMQYQALKPASEKYKWFYFKAYETPRFGSCLCGKECAWITQHINLVCYAHFDNEKVFRIGELKSTFEDVVDVF